ncbi:hypothetical protein N9J72_02980 [Candidatus Gracilibacteria bacterium]|nr:hypothetical protein [Candidatus Gracilibacteria bacterium]
MITVKAGYAFAIALFTQGFHFLKLLVNRKNHKYQFTDARSGKTSSQENITSSFEKIRNQLKNKKLEKTDKKISNEDDRSLDGLAIR